MFTYALDEVLTAFNTVKESLQGKIAALGREQILFVNECLRFLFYAYIFYNNEEPLTSYFASIKLMLNNKKKQ